MRGEPNNVPEINSTEELLEYYTETRSLKGNKIQFAWNYLDTFLSNKEYEFEDMEETEVNEFAEFLKRQDITQKTAEKYFSLISQLVNWYIVRGKYDYNPFEMAKDELNFEYSKGTIKREVQIEELREAISNIKRPLVLTFIVLLLKTGIRSGEAINLDYRDIHLDHPISEVMPIPRKEIRQKPDTIYIDSSVNEGEISNGERRTCSNKEKSYRAIPIDRETKNTLAWWIAMSSPTSSEAEPLFRKHNFGMGERYRYTTLWSLFVEWSQENGWHEWEGDLNVTPHWTRHWWTTTLRREIDEEEVQVGTVKSYVKSLRGDTGNDVIDLYTQDWGDQRWIGEVHRNNVPNLLTVGLPEDHYESLTQQQ